MTISKESLTQFETKDKLDIAEFNKSKALNETARERIIKSHAKTLTSFSVEKVKDIFKGELPTFDNVTEGAVKAIAKLYNVDVSKADSMTSALYTLMPVIQDRFNFALQNEFVLNEAASLFPISSVPLSEAQWYTFNKEDASRVNMGYMAEGAGTEGMTIGQSTETYKTRLRGQHVALTEEFMAKARLEGGFGVVGAETAVNRTLAQWLILTRIINYVNVMFGADKFDAPSTSDFPSGNPSTSWFTTGHFISDVNKLAREIYLASFGTVQKSQLSLAMTSKVFEGMQLNSTYQDYVSAGGSVNDPSIPTKESVAAAMGIKRIVFADAIQNDNLATEDGSGQTPSFVLDTNEVVLYFDNENTSGLVVESAVTNFACYDLEGMNENGVRTYPFTPTVERQRAQALAINVKDGPKVTDKKLGRRLGDVS